MRYKKQLISHMPLRFSITPPPPNIIDILKTIFQHPTMNEQKPPSTPNHNDCNIANYPFQKHSSLPFYLLAISVKQNHIAHTIFIQNSSLDITKLHIINCFVTSRTDCRAFHTISSYIFNC